MTVAFLSGLYLIGLNMENSREFLTAEFDLISCKENIRSRGRLTITYLCTVNTVTSVVCSIAIYLPFLQVISIFQNFLGNSNKSPLGATAQSLFILLKDHKSAEAITLIRESYENVSCQATLKQGYEIKMLLQQREQIFCVNLRNLSSKIHRL